VWFFRFLKIQTSLFLMLPPRSVNLQYRPLKHKLFSGIWCCHFPGFGVSNFLELDLGPFPLQEIIRYPIHRTKIFFMVWFIVQFFISIPISGRSDNSRNWYFILIILAIPLLPQDWVNNSVISYFIMFHPFVSSTFGSVCGALKVFFVSLPVLVWRNSPVTLNYVPQKSIPK